MDGKTTPTNAARALIHATGAAASASTSGWRRAARASCLLGCAVAIAFGASQAYATANPASTARTFCPDVAPCLSVCGEAGGIHYGLLPNGEALCDCCAPE